MSVLLLLRPILNSLPQRTHDGRWRAKPLSSLASYLLFDLTHLLQFGHAEWP